MGEEYMHAPAQRAYALSAQFAQGVLSVCDGMGGESYGEKASLIGVETFAESSATLLQGDASQRREAAARCIRTANAAICAEMQSRKLRIGTTAVLLCIKDNHADVFNVGDSRAYLFREGALRQLSRDHTVLQQKLDMGAIAPEEMAGNAEKHQLTQHLGIFESEVLIEAHHADVQLVPPW